MSSANLLHFSETLLSAWNHVALIFQFYRLQESPNSWSLQLVGHVLLLSLFPPRNKMEIQSVYMNLSSQPQVTSIRTETGILPFKNVPYLWRRIKMLTAFCSYLLPPIIVAFWTATGMTLFFLEMCHCQYTKSSTVLLSLSTIRSPLTPYKCSYHSSFLRYESVLHDQGHLKHPVIFIKKNQNQRAMM